MKVTIRKVKEEEFLNVYEFVSRCNLLENYAEHFYKIMLRYFGNSCFIADYNGGIVGFVLGFVSQIHDKTYFLWQVGIDKSVRREGIGKMLLETAEKEMRKLGCNRIELTIDPKNIPSKRLFEKMGYINVSSKEGKLIKVMENTAVKDYYKPGRHFMLYEKNI